MKEKILKKIEMLKSFIKEQNELIIPIRKNAEMRRKQFLEQENKAIEIQNKINEYDFKIKEYQQAIRVIEDIESESDKRGVK